jgi:hypothetical protein
MTEGALRAVLGLAAAFQIVTGALALIAPGTFFDEIGRYGIENSHYVGDVGAFTLAAGIALAVCVFRPSWRAPILWTGAIWFGLHALNHAFDTAEARSDARGWLDTVLLALGGLGSAYLANLSSSMHEEGAEAR